MHNLEQLHIMETNMKNTDLTAVSYILSFPYLFMQLCSQKTMLAKEHRHTRIDCKYHEKVHF